MPSVGSWNSTTQTHIPNKPNISGGSVNRTLYCNFPRYSLEDVALGTSSSLTSTSSSFSTRKSSSSSWNRKKLYITRYWSARGPSVSNKYRRVVIELVYLILARRMRKPSVCNVDLTLGYVKLEKKCILMTWKKNHKLNQGFTCKKHLLPSRWLKVNVEIQMQHGKGFYPNM